MAKSHSIFVCQHCSQDYPRWQGQCDSCGEWGTLVEEAAPSNVTTNSKEKSFSKSQLKQLTSQKVVSLSQVKPLAGAKKRLSTGIGEFDRVLGQGMVPGAVMLIGGEPGIGKSTLLTQVVVNLSMQEDGEGKRSKNPKPIIYLCGEESPSQISLRIARIKENEYKNTTGGSVGVRDDNSGEQILFVTSTDVDELAQIIRQEKPSLVIVDSIQTVTTGDLSGSAGSVGQIRESADRITSVVKELNIPTFIVGHVTKDGVIAGPKVLEHIVDAVIELSGERSGQLRLLRAIKNRFGATDEVGVFKVDDFGLAEVSNPSELFLEHVTESVPGSATVCVMEGTRPLLVETQALVVKSQLAMPRRVGRGIELSKIQVLAAVLHKHSGLPLGMSDIFVNVAGGFTVKEPAVDLGLAVAMVSSLKNKPLPKKSLFIGEVGLLGEIRAVSYFERREKEAKRLGFNKIFSRKTHKTVQAVLKDLNL